MVDLTADSLVVGNPSFGSPVFTQIHLFIADGLVTGSPILGTPAAVVIYNLNGQDFRAASPVVGQPPLAPIYQFDGDDLRPGSIIIGEPASGIISHFVGSNLRIGSPRLPHPFVRQKHVLGADPVLVETPVFEHPFMTNTPFLTTAFRYASFILRQVELDQSFFYWRAYEAAIIYGKRDDPNSFNKDGGKTGDLGFYPVRFREDDTLYLPCWDRVKAIIGIPDNPVIDGYFKVEACKLSEYLPTWVPGDFVTIAIPIMKSHPSNFNLSQVAGATVPWDNEREVFLAAEYLNDGAVEIYFTSDDPLD